MPLFTYSGPSTAATFVAGVFNDAVDRADAAADDAADEFTTADNVVTGVPDAEAASFAPTPAIAATTINLAALLARQDEIDDTKQEIGPILSGLVDKVDGFMAQFFPDVEDAVSAARAALVTLFAGSNMADGRALAQAQIEQAKEDAERNRTIEERAIIASWAARGLRAPPGLLARDLMQHRRASMHATIDAARAADRAAGEREAAALGRMLSLLKSTRAQALTAFGGFLARACAEKFDAARITTDARIAEFMLLEDSLREQLRLTNSAAALQIKAQEQDFSIEHGYLAGVDKLVDQRSQAQLQAALQLAKTLGSLAAQAYNNLRGSAGLSLSESLDDL